MKTKTLKDLFLSELADVYDAERQTIKALPRLARAASHEALRDNLLGHARDTRNHVRKLESVFKAFDAQARARTCQATVGLFAEADAFIREFRGSPARDAALVAAAQKVEHHEMASYGCLHEWARLLGNLEATRLLMEILQEEKASNESLTGLARAVCNDQGMPAPAGKPAKMKARGGVRVPRRGILPAALARRRPGLGSR